MCSLKHQIVRPSVQPGGKRTLDIERQRAIVPRFGAQDITAIDECEQALDIVIAVLAPPPDVQREIDLGISGFGQHRVFHSSILPFQGRIWGSLHVRIIRAAAAFGHHPVYVLAHFLDVAGLAMDAVLRIDLEAGFPSSWPTIS